MEMHHIYALSAVVCQPIKSYFPPTGNDYVVSGLNRSVCRQASSVDNVDMYRGSKQHRKISGESFLGASQDHAYC